MFSNAKQSPRWIGDPSEALSLLMRSIEKRAPLGQISPSIMERRSAHPRVI